MVIKQFIFILFICFVSCTGKSGRAHKKKSDAPLLIGNYDLSEYDKIILPQELNEISGICWDSASNSIAAVNDEDGKIFFLDPETGKVRNRIKFGKKGDYEEIFRMHGKWQVLLSSGSIGEVTMDKEEASVNLVEFINLEGGEYEAAWYDAANGRLCVFCKECGDKQPKRFTFYFPPTPGITDDLLQTDTLDLDNTGNGISLKRFRASGAAVHAGDGLVYLISSQDNAIIRMKWPATVVDAQKLDARIFKQPEGICFAPDGTMYISNEAAGGEANMLIFKPRAQ